MNKNLMLEKMEELKIIGIIHSPLKTLEDCPLQEKENAPSAIVEIYPEFREGISDLAPGDELIIFSWLHKGDRSVLSTRPRNDPKAKMTGVFSTRSPHRPNPIGMHSTTVLSVLPGNKIQLAALEALDGTPVIDIKPVLKQ